MQSHWELGLQHTHCGGDTVQTMTKSKDLLHIVTVDTGSFPPSAIFSELRVLYSVFIISCRQKKQVGTAGWLGKFYILT